MQKSGIASSRSKDARNPERAAQLCKIWNAFWRDLMLLRSLVPPKAIESKQYSCFTSYSDQRPCYVANNTLNNDLKRSRSGADVLYENGHQYPWKHTLDGKRRLIEHAAQHLNPF